MKRLLAGPLFVALASGMVGCATSGNEVSTTATRRFDPESVTVSVGETVTWTNDEAEAHTVTAYQDELPDGAGYWASGGATSEEEARDRIADGLLAPDDAFEASFSEPGTYEYFCIPHESEGMTGRVVVEDR
jgi:plastocyanin